MLEILNKSDMAKVEDKNIKEYLEYSFNRLPNDFVYGVYGYFVVVENSDELKSETINLSKYILKGLYSGMLDSINMIEIKDDVLEILVFVDNDVNISFVVPVNFFDEIILNKLKNFQIKV